MNFLFFGYFSEQSVQYCAYPLQCFTDVKVKMQPETVDRPCKPEPIFEKIFSQVFSKIGTDV